MTVPPTEAPRVSLRVPAEVQVTEVQRRQAESLDWWDRLRFWLFVASLALGALFLSLAAYLGVTALWYHGGRSYPGAEVHFKHGSIGAELESGMPYRILKVLPKVFPEHFGGEDGGWEHFGLIMEGARDAEQAPAYTVYVAGQQTYAADGRPGIEPPVPAKLVEAVGDPRASKGLPIGFASGWRRGVEVAWFNCAICHTGLVKLPNETRPRIVPGMPANTVDLERLFLALFDMAVDKRFSLDEFERHLPPEERFWAWGPNYLLWSWIVVPNTRSTLIARRSELLPLLDPARAGAVKPGQCTSTLKPRPGCEEAIHLGPAGGYSPARPADATRWGPGRVDTFNPYKMINFGVEADCLSTAERTGVSDFPSVFLQGPRGEKHMHLHWDGNNASLKERNLSAALGAGVSEATVDHDSLERVSRWLYALAPPESPYPSMRGFDREAARRGRDIYMRECASCHGYQDDKGYVFDGARLGQIEPIEYVATDRGRLDSYTPLMEKYQKDRLFCTEPEHRFRQFKKTAGYANMPLDGLWLRAPYLHNGSVPTLDDLLKTPAERPQAFRRGRHHITLDPERGGFAAELCIPTGRATSGGADSFCFDTTLPGNGNGGHLYGVGLPESHKRDLLSYLLTF